MPKFSPHSSLYFAVPIPTSSTNNPNNSSSSGNSSQQQQQQQYHAMHTSSHRSHFQELKLPWILPVRLSEGIAPQSLSKSQSNSLHSVKIPPARNGFAAPNGMTSNNVATASAISMDVENNCLQWGSTYSSVQAVTLSLYALQQQQQLLLQESGLLQQQAISSPQANVPPPPPPETRRTVPLSHRNSGPSAQSFQVEPQSMPVTSRLPSLPLTAQMHHHNHHHHPHHPSSLLDGGPLSRPWIRQSAIRPIYSSNHSDPPSEEQRSTTDSFGSNHPSTNCSIMASVVIVSGKEESHTTNAPARASLVEDMPPTEPFQAQKKRYSEPSNRMISTVAKAFARDAFPFAEPTNGACYHMLQRLQEMCQLQLETVRWEKARLGKKNYLINRNGHNNNK